MPTVTTRLVHLTTAGIDLALTVVPSLLAGAVVAFSAGSYAWRADWVDGYPLDVAEQALRTVQAILCYAVACALLASFRRASMIRLCRRGWPRDKVVAAVHAARVRLVLLGAIPLLMGVVPPMLLLMWAGLFVLGASVRYADLVGRLKRRHNRLLAGAAAGAAFALVSSTAIEEWPLLIWALETNL